MHCAHLSASVSEAKVTFDDPSQKTAEILQGGGADMNRNHGNREDSRSSDELSGRVSK
jgi:hypothetical protein